MIRRSLVLALSSALVFGCATTVGKFRRAVREPGEKLADMPGKVAKQYACAEKKHKPFFELERNEINPNRLTPGSKFNHRIVYAMCPRHATEVVEGTLHTRIRFKGRVIVDDKVDHFEIKPGRWVVDSFVRLPKAAEPGIYALEMRFQSASIRLNERLNFGVEPE